MSTGAYKPVHTHRSTVQSIRVWQARLRGISKDLQSNNRESARTGLNDLLRTIQPEAFPEFADNLNWLYRSALAHIDAEKILEAISIVESLHRLLELAAEKLQVARSSRPPFKKAD